MSDKITLSLVERYNIIKYAYQLPSNTAVRLQFDPFVELLELNNEEQQKYKIETANGEIKASDDTYTRTYYRAEFPEVILNAIKSYVDDITEASSGEKPSMDKTYAESITKWLKLVL